MKSIISFYIAWFFLSRVIISTSPVFKFLDYLDEIVLLVSIVYIYRHKNHLHDVRRIWSIYRLLIALFALSLLLNFSSVVNFFLILSSYTKPIVLGAVLLILFRLSEANVKKIVAAFAFWFLLQFPLLLVQFISGEKGFEAVDDMVGTFGFEGSLDLGYLAGTLACLVFPGIFHDDRRRQNVALFLLFLSVAVITGSKQVVLLVGIACSVFFLVFKAKNVRAIGIFALLALFVGLGAREVLRSELFSSDYEFALQVVEDVESTRKVEGLITTYLIFDNHPQYYIYGTGPGMYTSHVALNAETEYARTVNYAYFLQKPGEAEEGLGGTFNQASSSFLSLIGEVGALGYVGFIALVWFTYMRLRTSSGPPLGREIAFMGASFITFAMFFQNILEGGVAINLFWAANAYVLHWCETSEGNRSVGKI